jgi:hypothetical protein
MRYFLLEDIMDLQKYSPVRTKPHWSKRHTEAPAATKPTLWQRIKSLFV